ncbi:MAG: NAD(P)/FAD-dependent oxidoreductase [Acidobacteriota bacterium]
MKRIALGCFVFGALAILVVIGALWWFSDSADGREAFVFIDPDFEGRVIVVGAGAAGLTAGYVLERYGIDYTILEASDRYGGRMMRRSDLAEFPIDMGAEWIHQPADVLGLLVQDPGVLERVETISYTPLDNYLWDGDELVQDPAWAYRLLDAVYPQNKYKWSTWFDFFDDFIVPDVIDNLILESPVTEIDYAGEEIVVRTTTGESHVADRVIVTVSIHVLQEEMIRFIPELSEEKTAAIDEIGFSPGFKLFMKFSEKFYPDLIRFDTDDGEVGVYDAAFGKDATDHILGYLVVGSMAERYKGLDEREVVEKVLSELDGMFDGQASATFESHAYQNWTNEPYIGGAYSDIWWLDDEEQEILHAPLDDKVYFAGEAFGPRFQTSTVHGAAASAYRVVNEIAR